MSVLPSRRSYIAWLAGLVMVALVGCSDGSEQMPATGPVTTVDPVIVDMPLSSPAASGAVITPAALPAPSARLLPDEVSGAVAPSERLVDSADRLGTASNPLLKEAERNGTRIQSDVSHPAAATSEEAGSTGYDTYGDAIKLAVGTSYYATIEQVGEVDLYIFQLLARSENTSYTIRTMGSINLSMSLYHLFPPDEFLLDSDTVSHLGVNASITAQLGRGSYLIAIEGAGGALGSYAISIHRRPTVRDPSIVAEEEAGRDEDVTYHSATVLAVGSYHDDVIERSDEAKLYVFEVDEGSAGVLHTVKTYGPTDITIQLYETLPNEEPLTPFEKARSKEGTATITSELDTGTYLVEVAGYDGALGDYTILVFEQRDWLDGFFVSVLVSASTKNEAEQARESFEQRFGSPLGILRSGDFASLRPGYWVVYDGPYFEAAWSQAACWDGFGMHSPAQCYGRRLSQDPGDLGIVYAPAPASSFPEGTFGTCGC